MSREHLYKAKRVNWRELSKEEWWVEGHLTQRKDSYGKVFESWIVLDAYEQLGVLNMKSALVSEIDFNCYKVDPETVCGYTGLTDKNGKRFEGYIFQASDGDYIQRYIIVWNEDLLEWSAECIGNPDGTLPLSEFRVGEIEVIGNIFDNLELLEGDIQE